MEFEQKFLKWLSIYFIASGVHGLMIFMAFLLHWQSVIKMIAWLNPFFK